MKRMRRLLRHRGLLFAALFILVLGIAVGGYRVISGKPLGLRSLVENTFAQVSSPIKRIVSASEVRRGSQGNYTNIIFLHQSTGNNLINQGKVRSLFAEQGYAFWDHGYNDKGLRGPDGKRPGYNYAIPGDNTDPDGMAAIFQQPVYALPVNTFSALLQHEVIVFKSCFAPGNHITSAEQLEQYKDWYLEMREVMRAHPEKLFIIVTMPPLNPAATSPEEATRARAFAEWQTSEEYLGGQANIFTFDFFDLLAEEDPNAPDFNMLRAEYRSGEDSHPNQLANETIAPIFSAFIMEKAAHFRESLATRQ